MRGVRTLFDNLPSKRFALVLAFFCLFNLNLITASIVVADNPCPNSWNITLQGLKSTYNSGETISISATYSVRNNSLSPGTIQQILVGIIDENRQVYAVTCIYNGSAKVCPQETTGTSNFVLKCPSVPGTYQVLASNYQLYSCEDAQQIFPKNPASDRVIAKITISNSSTTTGQSPKSTGAVGSSSQLPITPPKTLSTEWTYILYAVAIIGIFLWIIIAKRSSRKRHGTNHSTSRYISGEVRHAVDIKCGHRCVRCGSKKHLEYDHIRPVSLGGSNTANNIQLLCRDCNRIKSNGYSI